MCWTANWMYGYGQVDTIERFTFGSLDLLTGVPFAAALVGLFGFAVVISDLSLMKSKSELVATKFRIKLPHLSNSFLGGKHGELEVLWVL